MQMRSSPVYSIVIPVYNTSESLRLLAKGIADEFENTIGRPYELIFVNDGSPNPDTHRTLEEIGQTFSCVSVVTLDANIGQHPATIAGMRLAKGEYVIRMDDDLQHRPENIPLLIAKQEHEAVVAEFIDIKASRFKKFGSWLRAAVILRDHTRSGIRSSSFALYHRSLVDKLIQIDSTHISIGTAVMGLSNDIQNVTMRHAPRYDGRSGYTLKKSINQFVCGFKRFRNSTLRPNS